MNNAILAVETLRRLQQKLDELIASSALELRACARIAAARRQSYSRVAPHARALARCQTGERSEGRASPPGGDSDDDPDGDHSVLVFSFHVLVSASSPTLRTRLIPRAIVRWLLLAVCRERLRRAERATERPFDVEASRRIDQLIVRREWLREAL